MHSSSSAHAISVPFSLPTTRRSGSAKSARSRYINAAPHSTSSRMGNLVTASPFLLPSTQWERSAPRCWADPAVPPLRKMIVTSKPLGNGGLACWPNSRNSLLKLSQRWRECSVGFHFSHQLDDFTLQSTACRLVLRCVRSPLNLCSRSVNYSVLALPEDNNGTALRSY